MQSYTDQLGNKIELKSVPKRIVSLVPSQSEYLWEIGCHNELVGVTKFCIHPPAMTGRVERIGGTKKLNIEKIVKLQPDLIIGNKEENDMHQVEVLKNYFPVWMSDIKSFNDATHMMEQLALITGKQKKADPIIRQISESFKNCANIFSGEKVAYLIWNKPYMAAASDTFIGHVLEHIGLSNVFEHTKRYPQVTADDLVKAAPKLVFLSSEPFPFSQKHVDALQKLLPASRILLVDGEPFSWYGPRLLKLPALVKEIKDQI